MGLCNSPDIFQEKMSELMASLEFCRTCIDDILITSRENFNQHLEQLKQALTWLSVAGLKIIASRSVFCRAELEYLGYWIICKGIRQVTKKVKVILKIKTPISWRELRRFIGMIIYYSNIWP